jgi:hypothetical protein
VAFEREDYRKALDLWEEILQLEVGKSKTNLVKFAFTDEVLYERCCALLFSLKNGKKLYNMEKKCANFDPMMLTCFIIWLLLIFKEVTVKTLKLSGGKLYLETPSIPKPVHFFFISTP